MRRGNFTLCFLLLKGSKTGAEQDCVHTGALTPRSLCSRPGQNISWMYREQTNSTSVNTSIEMHVTILYWTVTRAIVWLKPYNHTCKRHRSSPHVLHTIRGSRWVRQSLTTPSAGQAQAFTLHTCERYHFITPAAAAASEGQDGVTKLHHTMHRPGTSSIRTQHTSTHRHTHTPTLVMQRGHCNSWNRRVYEISWVSSSHLNCLLGL